MASARRFPDPEKPGQSKNLLEELLEHKPQYGAWTSQGRHSNRPWSNYYPHHTLPSEEKGRGRGRKQSSRQNTAPRQSRASRPPPAASSSNVPEPEGPPPSSTPRPSSRAEPAPPGPTPPGFGKLLRQYNSELPHWPSKNDYTWLVNTLYYLKGLAIKQWPHLDSPHAKAGLCKRNPNYSTFGTDPHRWDPQTKENLKPAFCVRTEQGRTPNGDGSTIGGLGHNFDPSGNAAWAALSSFQKIITNLQGLEPPGRLYVNFADDKVFEWCQTFVKVAELEAVVRRHRKSLVDPRSCSAWTEGTRASYEATKLKRLDINSLIEEDQSSGFRAAPLDAASAEHVKSLPLQAEHELEPSICQKHVHVSRGGKLSSKNAATYANGCFARAIATAEAVKAASSILAELLQFAVEGVTCFQDRIAPTLTEAANALHFGGHSDFLHRDYSLCIALVLSFFYKAGAAVAEFEAKVIKEPSTLRKLSSIFEKALFGILTDPEGPFKQKPGVHPEESAARNSAQVFISLVVFEASETANAPVDTSQNACRQFYLQAILDKEKNSSTEEPEDEFVRSQLQAENTGGQAPWCQPEQPGEEKDRNPGQASSSSCSGLAPPAPTEVEAAAEHVLFEPEHLSPVSGATAPPPTTDVPSPGSE